MIGDKDICKILSYDKETHAFIVQALTSNTRSILPLTRDTLNDKRKIFNLMKQGKTIPLLCIKEKDGEYIYTSNLHALDERPSISVSFSSENEDYNVTLFDGLYNMLGDIIDSDVKYDLAKQLILANRTLRLRPSLHKDIFIKCNGKYASKMWKENLITYTSNGVIANLWKLADEAERQQILEKIGISLPAPEVKEIEVSVGSVVPLFEDIANNIIKRIETSEHSVKIAVAWFTNFDLFNCIKSTLSRNIEVTLITNNDLINNGGYCLNFDELISCGLKLHLVEYPEMLHYKFCIIDDSTVITGSYNWTFYAEEINKEDVVVIDELPEVTDEFVNKFNLLSEQYEQVCKMPETVPERPQYDRGSFKEYISEELVLRAKRNIGDRKDNLMKARRLSPNNHHIAKTIDELGIVLDNSSLSIAELDQNATRSEIEERIQNLNVLQRQHETTSHHISELVQQKNEIIQEKEEIQREAAKKMANAETDEQRAEIQNQSAQQEAVLNSRIKQIDETKKTNEADMATVEEQINNINAEIDIIEKTSNIESIGGRGGLKITLKWTTTDDLDLHVFDPDEQEIFYQQKTRTCQGVIGHLDVDANANGYTATTTPVENIYWKETAPVGKYMVSVNLYAKRSGVNEIPFTVTVYPEKGESKVFTKKIIREKSTIKIIEFNYSDDGIKYIE
ncbi:MAG: hypothetical protein K2H16_02780 [Prevotella sp.]|nr:hypothetical protein [Prevotella sp.]